MNKFTTIILADAPNHESFKTCGVTKPLALLEMEWHGKTRTMFEHAGQVGYSEGSIRIGIDHSKTANFADYLISTNGMRREVPYGLQMLVSSKGPADSAQHCADWSLGPLLIVDGCTGFSYSLEAFVMQCVMARVPAGALIFYSNRENRYGYVDGFPWFEFGAEKAAISTMALAGAYYFKDGKTLIDAYQATPHNKSEGVVPYLSEQFKAIEGKKLAVCVSPSAVHQWHTPLHLIADKTITITDSQWKTDGSK